MKSISLLFTASVLIGLASCVTEQRPETKLPNTKIVFIEDYKTQCSVSFDSLQTLCILMTEQGDEDSVQLEPGIRGFDYEWGYHYELIIRETEPDPDFQDAPAVFRDLVEIVSKEKVALGTTFEMRLATVFPARGSDEDNSRQIITQEAPDLFAFFGQYGDGFGRDFTCEPALCEEMGGLIEQELELTLRFAHPKSADEPLLLKRIVSKEALPDWY